MNEVDFIERLASSSPTPGGGGASALVGAVAAALASMVGELTVGKRRYADVESEIKGSLVRLAALRSRLVGLVDEDAEAFGPLAAVYRMPKSTPEEAEAREAAMQRALSRASEVPLEIMRACVDVLRECGLMARCGSRMAVSDAGACAVLANAAARAASLNVFINANSMSDEALASRLRGDAFSLVEESSELCSRIWESVTEEIGGAQR